MNRMICSESIKISLAAKGWDQKTLAEAVGVSAQAVTNWIKGIDFPRPAVLLRLSTVLALSFDQLVSSDPADQPVVAFRKKAGSKTTNDHRLRAKAFGALLRPLVNYLPERKELRTQIPLPSVDYDRLQSAVSAVRAKLGIGHEAVLSYEHLIGEFEANDAVIIPVMSGKKQVHENALHILLPKEGVTFIYLNLDTHLEDFKFWMAHELAHVYTPELAGTEEGEDFADAFAGALLFPQELAQRAYASACKKNAVREIVNSLMGYAHEHSISLYSVYCEVDKQAQRAGLPPLKVAEKDIHAIRNHHRGHLVSELLFMPTPPEPAMYIAATRNVFKSHFFSALQHMLRERGTGAGYVQQVLDVSLIDAQSIHAELMR